MSNDPEMIRQRIKDTQSALAAKLEVLEEQVTQSVQATTTAVSDTIDAVREKVNAVKETVSDTVSDVREALDMGRQLTSHPLLFAGGAVALGYFGSRLVARRNGGMHAGAGTSWLTDLAAGYAKTVWPLALGLGLAAAREALSRAMPPAFRESVAGIIDNVATSFGGNVVRGRNAF